MEETKSITLLGNATKMLAEVQTIDDARQLMDIAASAKLYARKHKLGKEAVDYAHSIETQAEIKLGEILLLMDKNEGGNPKLQPINNDDRLDVPPTLSELGISLNLSSEAQALASLPEEDKTKVIKGKQSKRKAIASNKKDKKKEERKSEFIAASNNFKDNDIQIILNDFYEYSNSNIEDNSIDAIITDPPYPGEFLYLWEQLFEVAFRVLKPSSFLVCYSGQMFLDKIFKMKNDLIYYWMANIIFTQKPLIMGRNIINEWKPILIFQKPPFKKISDTISDTISFNYSERDLHENNWGQTIAPFEFLIDKFSNPNDLIFEPFAGTGTTLIACKNMARRCIATETDEQYIELIKGRLAT